MAVNVKILLSLGEPLTTICDGLRNIYNRFLPSTLMPWYAFFFFAVGLTAWTANLENCVGLYYVSHLEILASSDLDMNYFLGMPFAEAFFGKCGGICGKNRHQSGWIGALARTCIAHGFSSTRARCSYAAWTGMCDFMQ